MNGNALAVQNDRNSTPLVAEPFDGSPRQQWRVENTGDSAVLVNANGKAIDIPFGSKNNGVKINSYNRNNEINQRWQFTQVAGAGGFGRGRSRYEGAGSTEGRGGTSRYDTAAAPVGQRPDRDGMYYDDRDRTYKLDGNGVCLYRDRDFQGEAVCARIGSDRSRVSARFNGIGSVRFFGTARAIQLFDRDDYRGNAIEIEREERDLRNYRGVPRSIRIY